MRVHKSHLEEGLAVGKEGIIYISEERKTASGKGSTIPRKGRRARTGVSVGTEKLPKEISQHGKKKKPRYNGIGLRKGSGW